MTEEVSHKFEQLKEQLSKMFQLDRGDLDFGIYRIMNHKRHEIIKFLDEQLLPQVREILEEYRPASLSHDKDDLKKMIANLESAGVDPKLSSKVSDLQDKISRSVDVNKLEGEIYSDLYNFFKRYYSDGDFMSMRRYKEGVYAIPYEGEEVKLHWANHDQYYIKTSEDFKNYSFKTIEGKRVRFEVVSGSTETNNNKATEGKERRFLLLEDAFVEANGNELTIRFEYKPDGDKRKQEAINDEIKNKIFNLAEAEAFGLKTEAPTEKNSKRTLLEKQLTNYTAKNTFDYFIHRDLNKFLKQEFDFFIKNEILHLDDLENEDAPKIESYMAKIIAMRKVAGKIIQFLAQLENFQKKLWLKKKFVLEAHYCITLDHIIGTDVENELLSIIAKNKKQCEEWVKLFAINELEGYTKTLKVNFLKKNDKLLVDTKFFDTDFKYTLLSIFDDLDEETNGLLVNSENFQALSLLQERYKEKVKCIYIDPPYNAKSSEILYKNTYKHSSWLSLMNDRILASKAFQDKNAVLVVAIDEIEQEYLGQILTQIFPESEKNCIVVNHNPSGQQGDNFSYTHEYAYFVYPKPGRYIGEQARVNEKNWDKRNFRDVTGDDSLREAGPNCFYPIYVKDNKIIGFGDVCSADFHPNMNENLENGVIAIYPIDPEEIERKWRFERNTVESITEELRVHFLKKRNVFDIKRLKKKFNFKSNWIDSSYSANNHGTQLLNHIIPKAPASYPKSLWTVKDCLIAGLNEQKNEYIMDFFAGSGTTGHAVLEMNREYSGNRKYLMVEMESYFNTVLKIRMLKVSYSRKWKNGKPVCREGISQIFKYIELEKYEDALDNLGLSKSKPQDALLIGNSAFNEQYMLGYMLDVESRGSQSLLNVDAFSNPFNYALSITRNDDVKVVNVDLIETFNYLLGLTVSTINRDKSGIVSVTGKNSFDESCLIIWRNVNDIDNAKLDKWFSAKGFEFDIIYVNGDNNIENLKSFSDNWEVRLIETEFKRLMFDVQDI